MSVLLPITPDRVHLWAQDRPEPVEFSPDGWTATASPPDATFPNERRVTFARGSASVELLRVWDQPRSPGGPMVTAGEREVTVAGRPTKLVTTSTFGGSARIVEVLWLRGRGHGVSYTARFVFDGCRDLEIDALCARITVLW